MKYFLSYKFSDTPLETLHATIDPIVKQLSSKGDTVYCNLYDEPMYQEKKFTVKQIMEHALGNMDGIDMHVTLINTICSEGMLIEFGYALHMGIPRLLLLKKDVHSNSAKSLSDYVIEFEDSTDVLAELEWFMQTWNK